MAATASSAWSKSKPGAWALDAEEHEDELQQEREKQQQQSSALSAPSEFPSLAAAAATKQPKKKKNQTFSLAEFSGYSAEPKGLTHEEILALPTGPRQRSAEELDRSRLGGGFKSYGQRSNNGFNGEDSSNSRWGGGNNNAGGGSRFSNRESNREFAPSRADDVDDWSKTKKSPTSNGYESRRERGPGGSFFDSQSRADDSDSWVSNKPSDPPRRFNSYERRGSFDSLSRDRQSSDGFSAADQDSSWGRKKEESGNVNGSNGRPRLVLQPRTLPVSNGNGGAGKPKGASPFGEARPREEVLAEKGKDYKEIDEKLESLKVGDRKEVEKGRKSFGNGRSSSGNERTETNWRKPVGGIETDDAPLSGEANENVYAALEELPESEVAAEDN